VRRSRFEDEEAESGSVWKPFCRTPVMEEVYLPSSAKANMKHVISHKLMLSLLFHICQKSIG
jgi:hypothetical protein